MDIEESLHRILQEKENVASRFYPVFLERHPQARRYLNGVDMSGQAQLLRLALIMVERHHTHRYPATRVLPELPGDQTPGPGHSPRPLRPISRRPARDPGAVPRRGMGYGLGRSMAGGN
jgi:hypothetical protein